MKAVDLVREFCECNADKYYIYERYSGRGMFGRNCVGIVVKHGNSYIEMMAALTRYFDEHDFDDALLEFEGASADALGLDTIVYFPCMEG